MNHNQELVFGVFADPHYSLRETDEDRYFSRSLNKLRDCIEVFTDRRVDFQICLGDLIDPRDDGQSVMPQLNEMIDLLSQTGKPSYFVLGNHDVSILPRNELVQACRFPDERGYYSFDCKGIHFIVLDTNYAQDGTPYTKATIQWDRCYINKEETAWLIQDLACTHLPVIVFAHANLDFRMTDGQRDPHVIVNHQQIREILEKSGKVKAVIQGHYHYGYRNEINSIPYVTLPAMVRGAQDNYAMVVTCKKNGKIEMEELFGRIPLCVY